MKEEMPGATEQVWLMNDPLNVPLVQVLVSEVQAPAGVDDKYAVLEVPLVIVPQGVPVQLERAEVVNCTSAP